MPHVNTAIYDTAVQHSADVRLYENRVVTLLERAHRRHQDRVLRELSKNIEADLTREVQRYAVELATIAKGNLEEFASNSVNFHANNIYKNLKGSYDVKTPKPIDVSKLKIGIGGRSGKTLNQYFSDIAQMEDLRIKAQRRSFSTRELTNKQKAAEIARATDLALFRSKTTLRTALTTIESRAVADVIAENQGVFSGWRFTAVLDDRTSEQCASLDGRVFPLDNQEFYPPLHFNCRSTAVPVIRPIEELREIQGINQSKLEKEFKLPDLDGKAPDKEDFGDWLRRQTREVQMKFFGTEEKLGLFQRGTLQLREFFTDKMNFVSLAALRRLDAARTTLFPTRQQALEGTTRDTTRLEAERPYDLIRSTRLQDQLRAWYIAETDNPGSFFSLVDYRGTSVPGKRESRRRANNQFDERANSFDPFTGEVQNSLLYDPDFGVFQERLDFMRNSKLLTRDQKRWIEDFVTSLDDSVPVNVQSAIVENLRVVFERYAQNRTRWGNLNAVLTAESKFSMMNVSRILDRRAIERSQQFNRYLSGEDPKVQIFGRYYTLDELSSNLLKNQRRINDWESSTGRRVARSVYYSGRAPLRTYFFDPDKTTPDAKILTWAKKNIPGVELFLKKYPDDLKVYQYIVNKIDQVRRITDIDRAITSTKAQIRRIIDLEFVYRRQRELHVQRFLDSALNDNRAIDVLAKVMATIADGRATDYDSIAINVGKVLRENWQPLFPFYQSGLRDFHTDGSIILEALRQQGRLRVLTRGKTRRAPIDLDTGRPGGTWVNTTSREVIILDKDMLELQSLNRQVLMGQRFGIVNDRDRLYVRAGKKTYFDARGRDTGIPVITRRAFGNYDQDVLDKDFARMLNYTMSVKYETDQDFASFMDYLVRFRDPRGEVAKWDALNEFRKVIIQRGDQGYGFMSTVKWHTQRGKPFTVTAQIDSRGRVYYQGYLSPTGGEVVRPFMNSAVARNFGFAELTELSTQLGALIGPGTEALTVAGRLAIFQRNEQLILSLGRIMQAKTQRDRRIKDFLQHPLIREMEGEEVAKLARMALEYARVWDHVGGDFSKLETGRRYRTKLMVENDASASGLQILSLATRNRAGAEASNVVPTTSKNRLYDLVAMDTVADPEFQSIAKLANANITWEDLQKAAKSANMVNAAMYKPREFGETL